MARSVWAAAGAIALVLALSPGAALAAGGGTTAAHPAVTPAKHIPHIQRRPSVRGRLRPAVAKRGFVVALGPGTGYQQAHGSRRVRALQRRLAGLGFAPGPIDGRYGPLTAAAVARFQAAVGVPVDGITGPRTFAALATTPRAALFPGAGYQRAGGSGQVRALQRRLAHLGFGPGPIDGRYGPLTIAAVKRLQAAHDLTVDGIVGRHTLQALRIAGRRAVPIRPRGLRPPGAEPAPPARPTRHLGRRPRNQPLPSLPVALVLLGFVALGLGTIVVSYARTRARMRAQPRNGQPAATEGGPPRHGTTPDVDRGTTPYISRFELERAPRLQPPGARRNTIRTETGAGLGVNQFIRAREHEAIEHSGRVGDQHGGATHARRNGGEQ